MIAKYNFPEFKSLEYDSSMLKNLNFYSIEVDDFKIKKEWTLSYWKSQGKTISGLGRIPDSFYVTVGAVAHMIHYRKLDLTEFDLLYCETKYKSLFSQIKEEKESVVDTSKQDRDQVELKLHLAEFDAGIDMFFSGKVFDAKNYLVKHEVKQAITKQIASYLTKPLNEAKAALVDEDQLKEGYSHLTKRQLSKFIDYIQSLIDSCEIASSITRAIKNPRKIKVKSPVELTKKVEYMKEDPISHLRSDHPSKVVHSGECWVYNTKSRRLFRYVALDGHKLSVKGITIINFDTEKSGGKIIRNPEQRLSGIQNLTSRPLTKLFNDIKGVQKPASGRLSEDTLIVKCFN